MKTPYLYVPGFSDALRAGRRVIVPMAYVGDNVYCTVCDQSFRSWLGNSPHGRCPFCQSDTRQKFTVWTLENFVFQDRQPEATSTLYFAPDYGVFSYLQHHRVPVTTTDLGAPNVDMHADATALPVMDGEYQLAISCHVLEHIPDDLKAMSEMHRILSAGGCAIVQVPLVKETYETDEDLSIQDPSVRERRYGQFDHVRLYGMDIVDRLKSVGFDVEIHYPARGMGEQERIRLGVWDDVVLLCHKN